MATIPLKTRGAVIVARVSTGEQVKHGTSLEGQLEACRTKALALGIPIIAEYKDAGISGGLLLSRDGMQSAIADIKAGRADTLICANLSRYSRDTEHQQSIKKGIRVAGGSVVFCDMDFADTPEGDLNFSIQGSFAEYERKIIRKRTMDGKRRFAEAGVQPARNTPPFGYLIVTKNDIIRGTYPASDLGRYVIVESRATIVREIFERYGMTQESLVTIRKDLNSRGIPTPGHGACWHESTIAWIIRNTAYIGQAAFGKTTNHRDESRLSLPNPRTGGLMTSPDYKTRVERDQWTIIECPAIISQATWDAVQRKLSNHTTRSGNPNRVRMLSGRIYCAECGSRMSLASTPNRAYKREGLYYCAAQRNPNRRALPVTPCSPLGHKLKAVEQSVLRAIQSATRQPESIDVALAAYRDERPVSISTDAVRDEIAAIDRALDEIKAEEALTVRAQISGIASGAAPDVYAEIFAQIAARRKDILNRRALLTRPRSAERVESTPNSRGSVDIEEVLADIEKVITSEAIPDSEKRAYIATVVDHVSCRGPLNEKPGAVDIVFNPGLFIPDSTGSNLILQSMVVGWSDRIRDESDTVSRGS